TSSSASGVEFGEQSTSSEVGTQPRRARVIPLAINGNTQERRATGTSGVLYSGIPFFNIINGFKKLFAKKTSPKPIVTAKPVARDATASTGVETATQDVLAQPVAQEEPVQNTASQISKLKLFGLYLPAFAIGLEIGPPIMASLKEALTLPLSAAILVTTATYVPYLFGSFLANWLKTKIGRKATINTGLSLMAGSFIVGATLLGLDGSFSAWESSSAHFLSILGSITLASMGSVFIHNSVGPVMTEISKNDSDLVRQRRGTFTEFARALGMMTSFAFPWAATSVLGLDWSAPFLLALPFIAVSALGLNTAKIPNTKPEVLPAPKAVQSPVMDGVRKARKGLRWKNTLLNNSYVRLLKEEPGVGSFLSALFLMNAVEVGINSGFLFMLPQLTSNPSDQYLFGMVQFSVAFLVGRYLAGYFLKWFPKHNMSVANGLAGAFGLLALAFTGNVYGLTAALFASEVGISTAFTLAYARTAKNHRTQDRITSLISASAVACALGPLLFTQIAQGLMETSGMSENSATIVSLLAIPAILSFWATKLFKNMENKSAAAQQEDISEEEAEGTPVN
ncbi:MAG: MFS transporter, partial [Elusimicrobiaceae bacterium]|nr:MFS transporter [Elusimicrobiaceae bacterium]